MLNMEKYLKVTSATARKPWWSGPAGGEFRGQEPAGALPEVVPASRPGAFGSCFPRLRRGRPAQNRGLGVKTFVAEGKKAQAKRRSRRGQDGLLPTAPPSGDVLAC